MEPYSRLREILDIHPAGAPPSVHFDQILRILFAPEEAEVACSLNFRLQPVSSLAGKTGMEVEILASMLESMANRGIIMAERNKEGQYGYSLLPTIPGLFEFPFMRAESLPRREELARLWNLYHTEALGNAFASSPTPQFRVIPAQHSLKMISEILHYEQVVEMIGRAQYFAVTNCSCRSSMQACDHPLEVCLAFDRVARFLVERNRARMIGKEEALRILDLAEEAGLVHSINNSQERPNMLCNCCSCCCGILRGITELNNPFAIARSNYLVRYDASQCIGCFLCTEGRCPVSAVSEAGEVVAVNESACIGCGLCVSVCPTPALEMHQREETLRTPRTSQEMFMTVLKEKGKFKDFARINRS